MLLSSYGSPTAQREAGIFLLHPLNCLLILIIFFKASFQVLCPAGSESVATRHGPWHQDSAARPTGQGTVQSAGTQPHLCMEITVGLSASHPSFLCNWESFSALG